MVYDNYGDNSRLHLVHDRPTPKVGPGEIRIAVRRASVNPVDWKAMSGGLDALMDAHFPVVPGWDVAGTVDEVGIDVPEFDKGDEVIAYARRDALGAGTFAEYVTVRAEAAARRPASATWEESAGLPLAGLTALQVLDRLGVEEGTRVLIHNGSGGVGSLAVQIAVARGARVLATASEANQQRLRGLGATPLLYGEGLVDRVRVEAPDGVDVVADFVGGVLDATLAVLADHGRHASIADPSVPEHGGQWMWVRPDGDDLDELATMVEEGALRVEVARTVPLEELPDAFALSRDGHVAGKIVVAVAD